MKSKHMTIILTAVTIIIALVIVLWATFAIMANADEISGDIQASGDLETIDEDAEDSSGNWFTRNWKSIIEILTSTSALAVIFAIIKSIGKIAKLRAELGTTNTDNKALRKAFNEMVDEVAALKSELEKIHNSERMLTESVESSGGQSAAVLAILERLIGSSDLPSETKTALQGVINKATVGGKEQ